MIKLSPAFQEAYSRWSGEDDDVGPTKAPAPAADHDLERAFQAWEDVAFERLVDQMSAELVDDAIAEFDDLPTEEIVMPRGLRRWPRATTTAACSTSRSRSMPGRRWSSSTR